MRVPIGILVRPVARDERLAHHRDERAIARIGFADVAPALDRDAQRGEVAGRHVAQGSDVLAVARRRLESPSTETGQMPPRNHDIGRELTKLARVTPGMRTHVCSTRVVERFARHDRAVLRASAARRRMVRTPSGLNPGSMACTVISARISRPADTSSTTDATISATTSAERSRSFRRRPIARPRAGRRGRRRRRRAATGARPNAMPVSAVRPIANSSTRTSTDGVLGDRQRCRHEPRQQRHARHGDEHAERAADDAPAAGSRSSAGG